MPFFRTKKTPSRLLLALIAVASMGCASEVIDGAADRAEPDRKPVADSVVKATAKVKNSIEFDAGKAQMFGLTKVQYRIPRGTVVARYPLKVFACNVESWRAGRTVEARWGERRFTSGDVGFRDNFYDVMRGLNYSVAGDPGRLFNVDAERARAVYEVGAQITGLSMDLCVIQNHWFLDNSGLTKGTANLNVEWQVYSKLERRIVFKTKSVGHAVERVGRTGVISFLIDGAFGDAVENLGRNSRFFAAVSRDPAERIASARSKNRKRGKSILISNIPLLKGRLQDHVDRVRSAVVTIALGGGHGSGFFIDSRGYVLTNAHVVGDARFVRIELLNERGILGEVVRIDKRRDIAFIVTEERNFPALSIRTKPVVIAEDVFAIGTPLNRRLRTSVTKGTVSGFRDNRVGLKEIQADVDIQGGNSGGPLVDESGNVVGISVAGIGIDSYSVGVNFFIPIQDALRALNIKIEKRPAKSRDRTLK